MSEQEVKTIFVLSDGTGETVEKFVRAALVQFFGQSIILSRFKRVRLENQVNAIIDQAVKDKALIAFTIVDKDLRFLIMKKAQQEGVLAVDLMGPLLTTLTGFFKQEVSRTPGLLHAVNEEYFKRIDALEFTVKHDDGNFQENIHKADLVLVGVSRTSKTPLSIFLAHKGFKVANLPLVYGVEPTKDLYEINQSKVIGLVIDPDALSKIRKQRMTRLGTSPQGEYCDINHVIKEVEWSRQIFDRNRKWPIFDVTNKALEETASDIIRVLGLGKK